MKPDLLQLILQSIMQLLTQNIGFFDAMGQNLYRSFATIVVAWFGIKSALATVSGRPFHFDQFAALLLTVSFGFGMSTYYNTPLPGTKTSFHNLITDEANFLAHQIDQNSLANIEKAITNFEQRIASPKWGDILGTIVYWIVMIQLTLAQALAFIVVAFGFIASAVCVLVGPVFVPFFIVPKLEWIFWGWLRCFIQYAFYQVIASAVVFVIANLIVSGLQALPTGTISTVDLLVWFPAITIVSLAAKYALFKIPMLTNHIFSGTAGGSSSTLVERIF